VIAAGTKNPRLDRDELQVLMPVVNAPFAFIGPTIHGSFANIQAPIVTDRVFPE
jgi:hypothetical protein